MFKLKPVYIHVIRIFLGTLFVFSGVLKMMDLVTFSEAIAKFDILPDSMIDLAAIILTSAEIICGASLMFGIFKKGSAFLLTLLMIMFTIAISITLSKGITFDCECFGPLQFAEEMSSWSIIFNLIIIALFGIILLKDKNERNLFSDFKAIIIPVFFIALIGSFQINNYYLFDEINRTLIMEISFEKAKEIVESQNGIYVDARSEKEYNEKHLPGALMIPYGKVEDYFSNLKNIEKNKPLIVYCRSQICKAANIVAEDLYKRGFENLYVIKGRFDIWGN